MKRQLAGLSVYGSGILLVAAGVLVAADSAHAQPGKTCCFTNTSYSGECQVSPAPGETCTSILAYLNNAVSAGKTYCGSTHIRTGWRQSPCGRGAQSSSAATAMVVPSRAVMKVRMDDSLDLTKKRPGDTFTAHLASDLVADGALIAPTGAKVYGRLAVTEAEGRAPESMLELTEIEVGEFLDIEAAKLKLKKRYIKRFRGILPTAKVTRFFQVGNKLEAVIRADLAAEIPLVD